MARYYVNKNAQANGDHEVHRLGCSFMPLKKNRLYLGNFATCAPAVHEAKKNLPKIEWLLLLFKGLPYNLTITIHQPPKFP